MLLVKDDVGKPKPNTRDLPKEDFAFGKGNVYHESAAEGKLVSFQKSFVCA